MAEPEPRWCVVANVRPEAYGNASSPGTKHFRAGALLWLVAGWWGDRITVLGHHRVSVRFVQIVEERARLTNFRVKEAHHPRVIAALRGPAVTKAQCEQAAAHLNVAHAPMPDLRDEIERHRHAFDLFETDERGRGLYAQASFALASWTPQQRNLDRTPPHEAQVLADWLEDRGVPIALHELVRTLDRRRTV